MAFRIRIPMQSIKGNKKHLLLRVALIAAAVVALVFFSVGGYFYFKYKRVVEQRLNQPIFATTAKIYAAPREVRAGQKLSLQLLANELRMAGYTEDGSSQTSQMGTYRLSPTTLTVRPGPQSFHAQDTSVVHVLGGVVQSIDDSKGQPLGSYELEPLLITGLSDDTNRTKRRLLTYDELPQNLIHAVIAIEDRRFFEHGGIDVWRMVGALRNDVFHRHRFKEGASTLTQQLARGFFLTPEQTISRKLREIVISLVLEHKLTKQQIFEMYANQINLGQRGSFSINGFGEAAQAYFGKDIQQLSLSQTALLAGIIQSPNRLNPFRHPERAMERRNLVLDSMVETGAITKEQAERAKAEQLHIVPGSVDASEAPYFVDLVHEQIQQKLGDRDFNAEGLRIYTSLDPDLQREATAAVEASMHAIDVQVEHLHAKHKSTQPIMYPQVALVALNPHTGQVLALVGGRSYGNSQLNHAVAKRPTGSIFKPFVYATAFATAVEGTILPGQTKIFSPTTMLSDEQTTYDVGGQEYTPKNFEGEYHGEVPASFALQRSLNNATIGLASLVGFDRVASLAREAGVKNAKGTPAVAIGAYDATPLDMAGAYTIFANGGLHINPWMLASVRAANGDVISDYEPETKQVVDARVAALTTSMMQNVLRGVGTGAGVRGMGFYAPAAGKTGTSHDAWFAGYTTNLLCIVWVGNDDYTDVKIEGAHAAAPIWAEFMKRAMLLPQYSDAHEFPIPDGVDVVKIDKESNLLSDESCPDALDEAFLSGSAPMETCDHPADRRNIIQKIFGIGKH